MNDFQRSQLNALNQKVIDGIELNEAERQLRSELTALQHEAILGILYHPANFIVRSSIHFILNLFPYNGFHLMVLFQII